MVTVDFSSIDHTSSEQLYNQIRRLILTAIQDGVLKPGDRVPSMTKLARDANVSRMTVRQALVALVQEGWVYTVAGKGTFVADRAKVVLDQGYVLGWADELNKQGVKPDSQLVSVETVHHSRIAQELDIPTNAPLFKIVRLQLAENLAVGLDTTYLEVARYPGFDTHIKQNPLSVSRILAEIYDVKLVGGFQYVEAVEADKTVAHLLNIESGTPILQVQRVAYSPDDIPVEYVCSCHRSGHVRLKMGLKWPIPQIMK